MITSRAQNSPSASFARIFLKPLSPSCYFHEFRLSCLGNLTRTKFAICILKARLGGEISLSDVIMHRGYWQPLMKVVYE